MAFSFGAAPAPAPAGRGGGGSAAPPAAGGGGTGGPSSSSFGGFGSFGAPTPVPGANAGPAPAPAATTAADAPAATTAPAAPAPAAGFSFGGGGGSTAPVPAPGGGAPAPAAGASLFGGSATRNPSNAANANAPSAAAANAPPGPTPAVAVPPFAALFPRLELARRVAAGLARWKEEEEEIRNAGSGPGGERTSSFAAGELVRLLSLDGGGGTTATAGGEDGPAGGTLANPTSLLNFSEPDVGLRGRLNPAAPPGELPLIALAGTLASVTPTVASDVLRLADDLRVTEVEALALYAEATRRGFASDELDEDGEEQAGREDREAEEFVKMLIRAGGAGYEEKGKRQGQRQQQRPLGRPTSAGGGPSDPPSPAVRAARRLFFAERASLLATLSELIRHRVEAAAEVAAAVHAGGPPSRNSNGAGGREGATIPSTAPPSALLVATDQLLEGGLILNLIRTVREATERIAEVGEGLRRAAEGERAAAAAPAAAGTFGAAPPAPSAFGAGTFGKPPAAATSPRPADRDMDRALLGFAHLQRQAASECLFYLAYHTQLTAEEACGLIDLVRDLTNGSDGGRGFGRGGGLPLPDPLGGGGGDDVPPPHEVPEEERRPPHAFGPPSAGGSAFAPFGGAHPWQPHPLRQHHPPELRDPAEWRRSLASSLARSGRPRLLRCVASLVLAATCALDARHVLVDRTTHGPNPFGAGNALLPPPSADSHDDGGADVASSADRDPARLRPLRERLDPAGSAEESWRRKDVWGLLLVPYALLLRGGSSGAAASEERRRRGSPPRGGSSPAGAAARGDGVDGVDVRGTFSKCLTAAAQLRSLTFARLSLLPAIRAEDVGAEDEGGPSGEGGGGVGGGFAFRASVLADLAAQYVDALGSTRNFPISRGEWKDEEANLAMGEWMEAEQRRHFSAWAGTTTRDAGAEERRDDEGPRPVDVMDRPDCLEDVFALCSAVCEAYPPGAGAFWRVVQGEEEEEEEDAAMSSSSPALAPSRALQTLDLLRSEDDAGGGAALTVHLSFLAALALAEGPGGGAGDSAGRDGASAVHAFLSGASAINRGRPGLSWESVLGAVRWYAEALAPSDAAGGGGARDAARSPADRIRRSGSPEDASGAATEPSDAYYYGVGTGNGGASFGDDGVATPGQATGADRGPGPAGPSAGSGGDGAGSGARELDEAGRGTLLSLLCLIANVTSRCAAARGHLLAMRLPAPEDNGGGGPLSDGSLEILFSLAACASGGLPPDVLGPTFEALASLLHPDDDGPRGDAGVSAAGARAWEVLGLCQFVPIEHLSQYSSRVVGAGAVARPAAPTTTTTSTGTSIASKLNPSPLFPDSPDYGMVRIFERVEAPSGTYPATEGFLHLLSTLIRVAGCPSRLGSRRRLRPGCAPYVEYATGFVLPRAAGVASGAIGTKVPMAHFASAADRCRLEARALEVAEAALARYVVPPVKDDVTLEEAREWHRSHLKAAGTESGLSIILVEVSGDERALTTNSLMDSLRDFKTIFLDSSDDMPSGLSEGDRMLEASFGNQVPLPKTPGFAILSDLLSAGGQGQLFRILLDVLCEKGGSLGVRGYGADDLAGSLVTSLFRETPPNLEAAGEAVLGKARWDQGLMDDKAYQTGLSALRGSMIHPIDPPSRLTYLDRGVSLSGSDGGVTICSASRSEAVLWRERCIHLSLCLLCAAAVRERAFLEALRAAGAPLSVVPTLSFEPPIRGSFAHRFVKEEKVGASRLSLLLTESPRRADAFPFIASYVGYGAYALPHPLCIARASFGIVSYMCRSMPLAEAASALRGQDDSTGVQLPNALSRGLTLPASDDVDRGDLQSAILDLMLSDFERAKLLSNNSTPSIMRHSDCLNVVLELISEVGFVVDPGTSASATKCFELIYRACDLGGNLSRRFMEKLRRGNFWISQAFCYLAPKAPGAPSILQEVCVGMGVVTSRRDHDVLHSISWLLKGLTLELRHLAGSYEESILLSDGSPTGVKTDGLQSLLGLLLSRPHSMLLRVLMDLPLGFAGDGPLGEGLHSGAPADEALKDSSRPMPGPADICSGYQVIDVDCLLHHYRSVNEAPDSARDWALSWNNYVSHVCACAHITRAWGDALRASLIIGPPDGDVIRSNTVMDILCVVLLRLLGPSHWGIFGQQGIVLGGICFAVAPRNIESECAMPQCITVLCLTEILIESSQCIGPNVEDQYVDSFFISEEDVGKVCALIVGAISSCSQSNNGTGGSDNDSRAAVLSCALTRMMDFAQGAAYTILHQNTPLSALDAYAQAMVALFNLSTAPVLNCEGKYLNPHERKRGTIALAARSALSSLFIHLKSIEHQDSISELFCSKIFADDSDVAYLLQQIAMFRVMGCSCCGPIRSD
ncbi:hypothetical protein ACHAWF_012918 [Thalassiosira exigua]